MAIVRQLADGSRRDPIGCGMTKRVNLILPALLMLAALLALTVGSDGVSPRLLADAIGGGDPAAAIIILDIRLPRIVAAAVVGAALGLGSEERRVGEEGVSPGKTWGSPD